MYAAKISIQKIENNSKYSILKNVKNALIDKNELIKCLKKAACKGHAESMREFVLNYKMLNNNMEAQKKKYISLIKKSSR